MKELIKREKGTSVSHLTRKIGVTLLIISIAGSLTMSVEAVRVRVIEFITEVFEKFTSISYQKYEGKYSEDTHESSLPQYIPEGFKISEQEQIFNDVHITYQNELGEEILFSQIEIGSNNMVNITTPKLNINNTHITTSQSEFGMTMGSLLSESKTNICISRIYDIFRSSKNKEIMKPSNFGSHYDIDAPEFYYQLKEYIFKDNSNDIVAQYRIYSQQSCGMNANNYIIEDVKNSKWYSFTEEKYYDILDLENIGEWEEICNTIV